MTLENSKIEQLIKLLDKAEKLVGQFKGGYSDHFSSAEKFHTALKETIQGLKDGNLNELDTLFLWFSPSYDWDDFTGKEGMDLGNEIYGILLQIKDPNLENSSKNSLPSLSVMRNNRMKRMVIKFSLILLTALLIKWWLIMYSPLNVPEFIPHTPIRISGLLLGTIFIGVLIVFQKKQIALFPGKSIFQLALSGGVVCLIAEIIFQLLRQLTFMPDTSFAERIYYVIKPTLVVTFFCLIISFLVVFQLKTKRTNRTILMIIVALVAFRILMHIFGYNNR